MSDPAPSASLLAQAILSIGTLVFFHAAYSTYEYLGLSSSLGLVGKSIPLDVSLLISDMRQCGTDYFEC